MIISGRYSFSQNGRKLFYLFRMAATLGKDSCKSLGLSYLSLCYKKLRGQKSFFVGVFSCYHGKGLFLLSQNREGFNDSLVMFIKRSSWFFGTTKVRWTLASLMTEDVQLGISVCAWQQESKRMDDSTLSLSCWRLDQLFSRGSVCLFVNIKLMKGRSTRKLPCLFKTSVLNWLLLQVAARLNTLMNAARFLLSSYSRRIPTH